MDMQLFNPQSGSIVPVNKPVFRIGREKSYVDYVVANAAVSRAHCNLIKRDNSWYLVDLNSTNGTYVNGVKLMPNQEICLRHGDRLTLACVELIFECIPAAGAWEVFISFKNIDAEGCPTRDREMAESLYEALTAKGIRAFCASRSISKADAAYYKSAVNKALDQSRILVAVGTSQENLESPFVKSEIEQFRNDMLNGRKVFGTSALISYLSEDYITALLPANLRMQRIFTERGALVSYIESYLNLDTGLLGKGVR